MRSAPNDAFEHRGEMRLGLESHCQGYIDYRNRRAFQQFPSPANSLLQDKFVRSQICRGAELGRKVHSTQTGNRGQMRQRDLYW
jgi:hypothetical protein